MAVEISQARFSALKRQAKRLTRGTPGLTHSQSLDLIARDQGFGNWSLLARSVGLDLPSPQLDAPLSSEKSHNVALNGWLFNREPASRKSWSERIATKYQVERYRSCRRLPQDLTFRGRDEASIREEIATAIRVIHFMDETDLRPSRAWMRLFKQRLIPEGFDHTLVWLAEDNRYIVTTEPYASSRNLELVTSWCEHFDWSYLMLPKRRGLWNPCRPHCTVDCKAHTQTVVMAPPIHGGDVQMVSSAWTAGEIDMA